MVRFPRVTVKVLKISEPFSNETLVEIEICVAYRGDSSTITSKIDHIMDVVRAKEFKAGDTYELKLVRIA
jgi:hypothetical protein